MGFIFVGLGAEEQAKSVSNQVVENEEASPINAINK